MNINTTSEEVNEMTATLRSEAAKFLNLAATLESAAKLVGISPGIKGKMEPSIKRYHRLTPQERTEGIKWLKEGVKKIGEIANALGVTKASVYQMRNKANLTNYRRVTA